MVIKINYTSSDIYVSTNVSPVYVVVNYSAVNNGGGGGTVTSVGLTMPSAFAVGNSPVTSSGTLAVTGAGTADQYVRGDGQLANFPTNQGGGSSVNYYLNGSVNQGTFGGDTYYEMSKTPIIGSGTNFTRTNAQGNGYIASFITDAGDPALLNIPGGNWNLEFYFAASSGGGNPSFYAELYKVSSANVFTLIASGSTNPEGITNGTVIDQYFTSIPVPQTSLLATDRLAIRIFVTPSGRTITLHTEDNNLCEVLTTLSTGLNALNGLTAQVQYFATGTSGTDFAISSATDTHTFNLPTASGTNRGALSSADWTTFSGKVGGTGTTGQVAYWNGTSSQTGSNNLFWDAANARLGIGTNVPTASLQVTGSGLFGSGGNVLPILGTSTASSTFMRITNSSGNVDFGRDGTSAAIQVSGTGRLFISNAGNTSLGSASDGGQRLQVYGDAFIKGSGNGTSTTALTVQNSDGNFILSARNDRKIWIFSNNNITGLTVGDTIGSSLGTNISLGEIRFNSNGFIYHSSTSGASSDLGGVIIKSNNTLNPTVNNPKDLAVGSTFAPTSGTGTYVAEMINPIINQTGGANGITRGLYVNPTLTAAADWRSIEWSNNSGWGLYGAGTANNYLNGSLGISTTSPIGKIETFNNSVYIGGAFSMYSNTASDESIIYYRRGRGTLASPLTVANGDTIGSIRFAVQYNSSVGGYNTNAKIDSIVEANGANLCFHTNSGGLANSTLAERMRLTAAGRLLLGTVSEDTFKLDVNGTARVSGKLTVLAGSGITCTGSSFFEVFDLYGTRSLMAGGEPSGGIVVGNSSLGSGTGRWVTIVQNGGSSATGGMRFYTDNALTTQVGNFGILANQFRLQVTSTDITTQLALMADASNLYLGYFTYSTLPSSASLAIQSTTKGFLPPRMTTTQKNAIATPAAGLQVYDTTLNQMSYYNGTTWVNF